MRKRSTRGIDALGIGLLGAAALSLTARAQESETVVLDDVVVTATRLADGTGDVGSSVSVITADELSRSGVSTVLEALRLAPGLSVVQSGGPGRSTSVFIRGHNSQHTLVLIDGLRVNGNTGGGFDIGALTTNNVERIEIVRGPQSALYGSDAVAGVVNIITKRGVDGLQGSVEGAVGTDGHRAAGLSLSGGSSLGDFSLGYSAIGMDRMSVAAKDAGNSEEDGWRNQSLSGRIGMKFLENGQADLSLRFMDDTTELDGGFGAPVDDLNRERNRQFFSGKLALAKPVTEWYTQSVSIGFARDRLRGEDDDDADNVYEITSESRAFSAKADFTPFDHDTLSVSYDLEQQSGRNPSRDLDQDLDIHSILVQNHLILGDVYTLTLGARYDDHETFGDETTYRIAGSIRCPRVKTRMHASFGTGFRAPTLNDLYWPVIAYPAAWGGGGERGNTALKPETSKGFDVGVEQPLYGDRIVADVTYFDSKVEDLIGWAVDAAGWWEPSNVEEAEIKGVEVTLALHPLDDLTVSLGYTYTDHQDATTGNDLPRRPRHQGSLAADYRLFDTTSVNLAVIRVGKRYDDAANANELDSYTRVDLAVVHDMADHVKVFARVENLLDEEYEEARGFGVPGRYAYAGMKMTF